MGQDLRLSRPKIPPCDLGWKGEVVLSDQPVRKHKRRSARRVLRLGEDLAVDREGYDDLVSELLQERQSTDFSQKNQRRGVDDQRLLLTSDLLPELLKGDLDRRDLPAEQLFQKFCPAQSGNLRGFSLGDQTLGEPVNRRCQPHLLSELGWGLPPKGARMAPEEAIITILDSR